MFHTKKAFSLIEVLLAVTLFAIFAVGIVYVSLDTLQKTAKVELENEGLGYASEGLEAIYALRAEDYWQLSSGSYGLSLVGDSWTLTAAPEIIDTFYERTITIEDVYRDPSGNIVDAGGTLDIKMKKITSEVTWTWRALLPRTVRLVTYLSDWPGDEWIQTTCSEWSATGTSFNSTDYTETPAPPANNCALDLTSVEAPSDFYESVDIGEHGADVDVSGTIAYLASEKSAQGLSVVDISDVENPVILRKLDIGGKGRSVRKNGNYLYMGVESGSNGLAIINVTDPANPSITSQLNLGSEGNRFQISGNYLYMGT
ncbi:MAG: prepilin-type N-terminal cleavage/methylation domain-containing protein, partial [Patescibacteria group bacterium]